LSACLALVSGTESCSAAKELAGGSLHDNTLLQVQAHELEDLEEKLMNDMRFQLLQTSNINAMAPEVKGVDAYGVVPSENFWEVPSSESSIANSSNVFAPYWMMNGSWLLNGTSKYLVSETQGGLADINNDGEISSKVFMGYKHYQFQPLAERAHNAKSVQISELTFWKGTGQVEMIDMTHAVAKNPTGELSLHNGPSNAIDGNTLTKWEDMQKQKLIIEFPDVTDVYAYTFMTADDKPHCDPVRWKLEGSTDGYTWETLHGQLNRDYPVSGGRHVRVPPKSFFVIGFTDIRFTVVSTRTPSWGEHNPVQVSEIIFKAAGMPISMAGVEPQNVGGSNPPYETPLQAIDGNMATKWLDFASQPLTLHFPRPVPIQEFGFITANDHPERDPVKWLLEGARSDGVFHVLHDQQARYPTPTERHSPIKYQKIQMVDAY